MANLNKLLLNTSGHCFLCLKLAKASKLCKTESNGNFQYVVEISSVPKVCSLKDICSHLNISLKEAFENKDVELQGSFCNECANLLDKFSNELLELKRIRMRLQFRLNLICDKIKEADGNEGMASIKLQKEVSGELRKTTHEDDSDIDVVIVELLRRRTVESCINKFGKNAPRVRLQNLTTKQISKERLKLSISSSVGRDIIKESTSRNHSRTNSHHNSENSAVPVLDSLLVKVEESNDHPEQFYLDEFIQPFLEGDDGNNGTDMSPPEAGAVERDLCQLKKEDEHKEINQDVKISPRRNRSRTKNSKSTIAKKLKVRTTHSGSISRAGNKRKTLQIERPKPEQPMNNKPFIIVRSSQSPGKNDAIDPSSFFNSKRNRYECNLCSNKQCVTRKSFSSHYNRNHLHPVKYRCVACGLEFSRADACQRHHRVIHEPVVEAKFKCIRCNKVFQRKDYLTKHQESDCRNCPGFKYHQIEINK